MPTKRASGMWCVVSGWFVLGATLWVSASVHQSAGAAPAGRRALERIRDGTRVAARALVLDDGTLIAEQIERRGDADRGELIGRLDAVDAASGTLTVSGMLVRTGPQTRVSRETRRGAGPSRSLIATSFAALGPDLGVRLIVRRVPDGAWLADAVQILDDPPDNRVVLVGLLERVESVSRQSAKVQVLGLELIVNGTTELIGFGRPPQHIVRPRLGAVDDDDLQFRNAGRSSRRVAVAGELRVGFESAAGSELGSDPDEDDAERSSSSFGVVGLAAELGPVFAYLEAVGRQGLEIDDSDAIASTGGEATLGEAYVEIAASRQLSVAIGRQRFKETRRWYYDRSELDAVRLLLDLRPLTIEASLGQDSSDGPSDPDRRNYIGRASVDAVDGLQVDLYYLAQEDRSGGQDSPTHYGLRFHGSPGRRLRYWVEAAAQRGTRPAEDDAGDPVGSRQIRGRGLDAGLSFRPRVPLDPTLTLAYAWGSGDGEPCCPVSAADGGATAATPLPPDRRFAQTGLHRNRGRFNGNVSFAYYGEALDPELSNLHIGTVGLGIRPVRALSLDAVYHTYRQDVAVAGLYGADLDVEPLGLHDDIGHEWDLVLGYEPNRWFELRFSAGRFVPGAAFADPADPQAARPGSFDVIRLRTRFRF